MSDAARNQGEAVSLTRTEAIRRAIDALGAGAQVPQLLEYIWEHFGIGVPPASAPGEAGPASAVETLPIRAETAAPAGESEEGPASRKAAGKRGKAR